MYPIIAGIIYIFVASIAMASEPFVQEFVIPHDTPNLHIIIPPENQDMQPFGPTDFTVVDGRLAVLDTYGSRIAFFNSKGDFLNHIALPEHAQYERIVRDRDKSIVVFGSIYSQNKMIIVHIQNGVVSEKSFLDITSSRIQYVIPDDFGFFLERTEQHLNRQKIETIINQNCEQCLLKAVNQMTSIKREEINRNCLLCDPKKVDGIMVNGQKYYGNYVHDGRNPSIFIGDREVPLVLNLRQGDSNAEILQIDVDGTVWVKDRIDLDADHLVTYIWKIDRVGKIHALYRLATDPEEQYLWYMHHDIVVGDDGKVYAMLPHDQALKFIRLKAISLNKMRILSKELDSILLRKKRPPPVIPRQLMSELASSSFMPLVCRTRMKMVSDAYAYSLNITYLQASSIDNNKQCDGRIIPPYLVNKGAGSYISVSYNWGGFDSISEFKKKISSLNMKAGNVNTSNAPLLACAAGVDCSGFISQIWGMSLKLGTWDIYKNTYEITQEKMLSGDVYVKPGEHVMMYAGNGKEARTVTVFESSVYPGYVIQKDYSLDYLLKVKGYLPHRAINLCNAE